LFVKPVGAFLSFAFILATIMAIKNHNDVKKIKEVAK
jgi:hypothetical protein